MKNIDIHGMTNMELIRGGIAEWYWATDYIHGDLYEAEELFRQGHLVRSNRLYIIHYPDGRIYEPVHSADGQYLGTPVYEMCIRDSGMPMWKVMKPLYTLILEEKIREKKR